MKHRFAGFPEEGLAFLRALARHNKREWFQPRKHIYEEMVKAPMIELITALGVEMMEFAPDYVGEPERAIYRIYRDTRFSKDKTPYKTHIAASMPRRGMPRHETAGYYFSVGTDEIEVAGGVYMPGPDQLMVLRTYLLEQHEPMRRLISGRAIRRLVGEMKGEQLARVPKGFPASHEAADLLRYKQFYFYVSLDPSIAGTPRLLGELVKRFRVMAPFIDFLNAPLMGRGRSTLERRLAVALQSSSR